MRTVVLLSLLMALAPRLAFAEPRCQFPADGELTTHIATVTVGNDAYAVRPLANRRWFHDRLLACGYATSARHFHTWRSLRLTTDLTLLASLPLLLPPVTVAGVVAVGVLTPTIAILSAEFRQEFEEHFGRERQERTLRLAQEWAKSTIAWPLTTCATVATAWDSGRSEAEIQRQVERGPGDRGVLLACLGQLAHPERLEFPAGAMDPNGAVPWEAAGLAPEQVAALQARAATPRERDELMLLRVRLALAERRVAGSVASARRALDDGLDEPSPEATPHPDVARLLQALAAAEREALEAAASGRDAPDRSVVEAAVAIAEAGARDARRLAAEARELAAKLLHDAELARSEQLLREARLAAERRQGAGADAVMISGSAVVVSGAALALQQVGAGAVGRECRAEPFQCGRVDPVTAIPGIVVGGVGLAALGLGVAMHAAP